MINKQFLGLAAASVAIFGLTACSSSDDPGNEPITPNNVISSLNLTQNSTANRVINLLGGASSAKALSRAVSTNAPKPTLSMPTVPATSDAVDLTSRVSKLTEKTVQRSNSADITISSLDLNGQELVVKGNLTLNGITGTGTIYVDGPKAKLTLGEDVKELNGVTLVLADATQKDESKAALVLKSNTLTLDKNAAIYANNMVNLPNVALTNNGKIYVGANKAEDAFLHVASANLGAGSETDIAYNLNVDGDLTVNGSLFVGKTAWAQNITVGGTLVSNQKINAYKGMTVSGKDAKVYADYLKVGGMNGKGLLKADGEQNNIDVATLTQADGSQIILGNQGFIEVYNYENKDNGNAFIDCDATNGLAILHVQNLRWDGSADPDFLHTSGTGTEFGVQFAHAYKQGTEVDWDDLAFNGGTTRKIKDEKEFADMSIPANEATAFLGYNAAKEGAGKDAAAYKLLRAVSEVTYGENADGLSATCVQTGANNNVYVSYHSRGGAQAGRLEVLSTNADATTLKQSISAQGADNAIDWNHVTVAGNTLLGVGNSLKGGLLTAIALNNDGTFNTADRVVADSTLHPLRYVILRNGDGNAVIANGDKYDVASQYGVEQFNQDLRGDGTQRYPGSGKHIAINGNTIATAYFTGTVNNSTDETAKTPATLRVATYAAGNTDFSAPTATTDIAGVYPTNGKNTVAIADGKIYVAAGALGLKIIDGSNVTTYLPDNATVKSQDADENLPVGTVRGYCNGVTVKGDYIYLAYGSLGVIVLPKNDPTPGKEVAVYNAGKSANYVTVTDNGYIYVAYGQNRLKVLKLVDYNR